MGTPINVDETNFEFLTFVTIDSACMPVVAQVDVQDEMLLLGLSHTLIIWQIAAPSLSSYFFVNENDSSPNSGLIGLNFTPNVQGRP